MRGARVGGYEMPAQALMPYAENTADVWPAAFVGITDGGKQGTIDQVHDFIFRHRYFLRRKSIDRADIIVLFA